MIYLWLLTALLPGVHLAVLPGSIHLPEIGMFLTFVQPKISLWKGTVAAPQGYPGWMEPWAAGVGTG